MNNGNDHIKENLIKPTLYKRMKNKLIKIFTIFVYALVFGIVAAFSFILILKNYKFGIDDSYNVNKQVVIPKDEESDDNKVVKEEPVEDIVQSAIENYQYSSETMELIYKSLSDITKKAEKSIVSIKSVVNKTDFFNNNIELFGVCSGIVIAENDYEFIIAYTNKDDIKVDSLKVGISDGSEYSAELKRVDRISGINVLSVQKSNMDDVHRKAVEPIILGNSYKVSKGDIALIIGSPLGILRSVNYGIVSYVAKDISVIDGYARFFYTNVEANSSNGSYLLNARGELVGIATSGFDFMPDGNKFIGISDIKELLERMSNNKASAYLGISAVEINDELSKEEGLPKGLYITNIENDSSAYIVGMKPGDIIVNLGNNKVNNLSDYKRILENSHVEDNLKCVIMRNSIEGYKEMTFNISVISR